MQEAIDTLARLVGFPTVSDRPVEAIAAYLAERSEAAGFRVERFETSPGKCNVVASAGPVGTDGLVISGHMDVVPTEGQDWTSDPFQLHIRDGRMVGRGACDMKGFLAAVLCATESIPVRSLDRELVLAWTHDEETGCKGSAALVSALQAEGRPLPSLAWIGEPTDFRVCRMHPGHLTLRLQCTGIAAHSSRPELGASAIRAAGRALAALEALEDELYHQRAFETELDHPYPVMNVGMIRGGTAVNIVPDACEVRIGVRPLPGQSVPELFALFQARIDEVDAEVRAWGAHVTLAMDHLAPALLTERGTALETLLSPHACTPECGAVPFATDGGNLAQLGLQTLIFGPGSIDVAHRPDEHLDILDYKRAIGIIAKVVQGRCQVG